MSMLQKFLKGSAIVSGLVAMSLVTIPYADAAPKRGKTKQSVVKKSNSRVAVKSNNSRRQVVKSRAPRAAASNNRQRSRQAVRTSAPRASANTNRQNRRQAVKSSAPRVATNNNRQNRTAVRNNNRRGSASTVVNNARSKTVVNNNRNRTVVRNNGNNNTTVINNTRNRTVVRNGGRDAVIRDVNINRVVGGKNKRRYNNGYRYRDNRYYRNGYRSGFYSGAFLYSSLNSHYYYDNYYNSAFSFGYSSGYPYHGYGPRYGWGSSYYYRPRTRVVYVDRPVETTVVYQQQPAYVPQPQQQVYGDQGYTNGQYYNQPDEFDGENCQQVREYTTTIEIGGESVPAYGNACLMPDGSWKFGDPITEPSF